MDIIRWNGDGEGSIEVTMKTFGIERSTKVPFPLEGVFDFFARAENLELLTPPWLSFQILTPRPIRMNEGALIDYRLRLHGIPLRWRSEITAWEPPHRFVDEQRRGPYRLWVHEHRFTEADGGTRVEDRVRYSVLGGALVDKLLVAPDVKRIFDYRQERLRPLLETAHGRRTEGLPVAAASGVVA